MRPNVRIYASDNGVISKVNHISAPIDSMPFNGLFLAFTPDVRI